MTLAIDKSQMDLAKNEDDEPYRRIWASVLYLAIRDCNRAGSGTRAGYRRAAMHWIYSHDHGPGSLRWICDMLDLDHRAVQNICMTREGRSKILKHNARLSHVYRPAVASVD